MLFTEKSRGVLFVAFAIILSIAAIYHLTGVFITINDAQALKHFIFFWIDLLCVYGALKRPKYFTYLVLVFFAQQYYTHGSQLINQWNASGEIHWISVLVLLLFPVALVCLIEDYNLRRR